MPACHGRPRPRQTGVKLWIETIAGTVPVASAASIVRADRVVIGPVVALDPFRALALVDRAVSRNHRPVGEPHDQRRIVAAAIGIDQETRELRQHRRRVETPRQRQRHGAGAGIPGDVTRERVGSEPQRPISGRDAVLGMIADQDEAARRVALDDREWRKAVVAAIPVEIVSIGAMIIRQSRACHRRAAVSAECGRCPVPGHDAAAFAAESGANQGLAGRFPGGQEIMKMQSTIVDRVKLAAR